MKEKKKKKSRKGRRKRTLKFNLTKKIKPLFSKSEKKVETREITNPVAGDPFKVRFP